MLSFSVLKNKQVRRSFFECSLCHIINLLLTKLVRSRWLGIGLVLFLRFLWTSTSSRSIKTQKENSANIQPSWPRAWSIIYTYDTHVGWRCLINSIKTEGPWTQEESNYHINYLEMLAVYFGFKAHKNLVFKMHVKVLVDNTTVQNTLNKMGTSQSPSLNSLIKSIWDWFITHEVWITIARIPGKENVQWVSKI